MNIETRLVGSTVAVVSCIGRLNLFAAPALNTTIAELIDGGRAQIVIDLSETAFLDSSGLGALIAGLKKARHVDGDLRLSGARSEVLAVLRMTNVDRLLTNHRTVADALSDW